MNKDHLLVPSFLVLHDSYLKYKDHELKKKSLERIAWPAFLFFFGLPKKNQYRNFWAPITFISQFLTNQNGILACL